MLADIVFTALGIVGCGGTGPLIAYISGHFHDCFVPVEEHIGGIFGGVTFSYIVSADLISIFRGKSAFNRGA